MENGWSAELAMPLPVYTFFSLLSIHHERSLARSTLRCFLNFIKGLGLYNNSDSMSLASSIENIEAIHRAFFFPVIFFFSKGCSDKEARTYLDKL